MKQIWMKIIITCMWAPQAYQQWTFPAGLTTWWVRRTSLSSWLGSLTSCIGFGPPKSKNEWLIARQTPQSDTMIYLTAQTLWLVSSAESVAMQTWHNLPNSPLCASVFVPTLKSTEMCNLLRLVLFSPRSTLFVYQGNFPVLKKVHKKLV